MTFFKKLFGSNENKNQKSQNDDSLTLDALKKLPGMTDRRLESISTCLNAGFTPSNSLPTAFNIGLRPSIEIAQRLNAIKALVLWLMVPEDNLPSDKILNFVHINELEKFMTDEEKKILHSSRGNEELRDTIGWKFENAWPLAWYFGYKEPEITGQMMAGEQMGEILANYTCPIDDNIKNWIKNKETISEESLIKKEDLFYCLHNAVRSAQLGHNTVPKGFDPAVNGGVIHERRHSLTWMLSKDTEWNETDLST